MDSFSPEDYWDTCEGEVNHMAINLILYDLNTDLSTRENISCI